MTTLASIRVKINKLDKQADEQKKEVENLKNDFTKVIKTLTNPLEKENKRGNS